PEGNNTPHSAVVYALYEFFNFIYLIHYFILKALESGFSVVQSFFQSPVFSIWESLNLISLYTAHSAGNAVNHSPTFFNSRKLFLSALYPFFCLVNFFL